MDAARLRRRADIANVRTLGRERGGPFFSLRWTPNTLGSLRSAVTAAGGFRTAVSRNRARRRVREAFRASLGSDPRACGVDLVVSARRAAISAPWAALRDAAMAAVRDLPQ